MLINVTVHTKTSLVGTRIEIHFFTPAYSYIRTLASYLHSMSPMARLNWSVFLAGYTQLACSTGANVSINVLQGCKSTLPSTGMVSLWSS